MKDCTFYKQGRCVKGSFCNFGHDSGATSSPPEILAITRHTLNNESNQYIAQNERFSSLAKAEPLLQDSRALMVCKYYQMGSCRRGSDCAFAHPAEHETQVGSEPEHEDHSIIDFSRQLAGTLVYFEDGARVSKITLSLDYSAVRIKGLPLGSTKITVTSVLHECHFQLTSENAKISLYSNKISTNADVSVEDPLFAKAFCAKVEAHDGLKLAFPKIEVSIIPASTLVGATGRRNSSTKVQISWHKPTRTVWLNFGPGNTATRVHDKYKSGAYKILQQIVEPSPPKSSSSWERRGIHPITTWSVMLRNVPCFATKDDIAKSIHHEYDRPRHIELAKSNGFYDSAVIPACIESLLNDFGPHEVEIDENTRGKRCKATARFEADADARKAVKSLHDQRQEFLNNAKLTVQIMYSAKFKILTTLYDVLAPQITARGEEWKKQQVNLAVYRNTDSLRRFTTLKIDGEHSKQIADVSDTLEKILAGKVLENDGTLVWSTSLSQNGDTYYNLRRISSELGALVVRDKAKRQLKFFGLSEKYDQLRKYVVALVRADSTAVEEKSQPRLPDDARDCTICWTEAENPILTTCQHLYCLECFEDLCKSGGSSDKEFVVCCQGDLAKCKTVISLPEIQEHLSSTAFESVLEASFASFVRRHPQTFRYCPSPDCGYVYRTGAVASTQTCPKCLEMVCTGCHEQHGTLSCAEYRDISSGGYEAFEKYKKEMGIKDCPKCSTPMEKTDGCDHMTCGGCNAHICWVCLKVFTTSGPCYQHMTKAHGGIGLNHLLII